MNNFLRKSVALLYVFNLLIVPTYGEGPSGESANIKDVRVENGDVIIDMDRLTPYDSYVKESPNRLILEFQDSRWAGNFKSKSLNTSLVSRVRGYQFKDSPMVARVILDLKSPVDFKTTAGNNQVVVSMTKNEVLAQEQNQRLKTSRAARTRKSGEKTDLLRVLPKEVVTLDFEGADLKDVIRLLSETSGFNIIYGPEVSGSITVHLKQVPFDEAFRTILNLKGLVATQIGNNIIRVTTPDLLSKERSKAVNFTKTIQINYVKAADLMNHIQSIIVASGRKGTITVMPESNQLVLTDTEEGIEQAEILISQLDRRPKQVMIESRIIEINLNNGFDIGVQWEYFNQTNGGMRPWNFFGTGGIGVETDPESRVTWERKVGEDSTFEGANGPPIGTGVNLPGNAITSAAITFGFVKNNSALSTTLAALITQSRAKILSSPKVVTVNGQEAKIEAVQDIPFQTSTVSGTGVVSNSFTTVKAGIILTVQPTINAENRITLKIKPESSFPTDDTTDAGPVIRTRNAQTTVIVKDGDTLVIGGLIDDSDTKSVSKVPLLGDIPIIGAFFRTNSSRKIRNELLVFVTPRIIRD